ncbi:thyrotropin releasing hormone [Pogona vitticeps]|uniref:Pro-thyrotropin-releasing hormone n=1 Tax=Pogona vitticeps TaxID=103695 RepID=A0A6J0UCI8_9SAUR|nr:thyrotropin releasing hormone [Pogona vitticeps]
MAPAQWLLLLLSLAFISVSVNVGQLLPEGDENEEKSHLDDIVQKAENILLRSVFRKVEEDDEDPNKESDSSQLDWISKRQHPGKRSLHDLEKRQHPGKREENNDVDPYTELEKRQHPGKRSLWDPYLDIPSSQLAYLNELSKRQHPGKRYLVYSKRQHPGKRGWDEETEEGEQTFEKRQHPGKRYLGSESPDSILPCDPHDALECSKGSLLLELLDSISKGRAEEKRQHPGRRALLDGEVEAEE